MSEPRSASSSRIVVVLVALAVAMQTPGCGLLLHREQRISFACSTPGVTFSVDGREVHGDHAMVLVGSDHAALCRAPGYQSRPMKIDGGRKIEPAYLVMDLAWILAYGAGIVFLIVDLASGTLYELSPTTLNFPALEPEGGHAPLDLAAVRPDVRPSTRQAAPPPRPAPRTPDPAPADPVVGPNDEPPRGREPVKHRPPPDAPPRPPVHDAGPYEPPPPGPGPAPPGNPLAAPPADPLAPTPPVEPAPTPRVDPPRDPAASTPANPLAQPPPAPPPPRDPPAPTPPAPTPPAPTPPAPTPPAPAPPRTAPAGRRVAVVVGVSTFADPALHARDGAAAGAHALADALARGGVEVKATLVDAGATRAAILAALADLERAGLGDDDTAILVVTARGLLAGGEPALAVADSALARPAETLLQGSVLAEYLDRSGAGQVAVVVDAGDGVNGGPAFDPARLAQLGDPARFSVLATRADAGATRSDALVAALTGARVDADQDGAVRWVEVARDPAWGFARVADAARARAVVVTPGSR